MAKQTRILLYISGLLSIAGVVLYNNWLLAIILNLPATLAGATTSELGVVGQPHYLLFRWLDVSAGICFILGTLAISSLARHRWLKALLQILVILLGCSTIAESLLIPLQCSSALSAQCAASEATGTVGGTHELHIIESIVSYALIALLPTIVALISWRKGSYKSLRRLSVLLVVYMAVWFLESWYRSIHHARSYGYEQRLFILLFSVWYISAVRSTVQPITFVKKHRLTQQLIQWQRQSLKTLSNRLVP